MCSERGGNIEVELTRNALDVKMRAGGLMVLTVTGLTRESLLAELMSEMLVSLEKMGTAQSEVF